MNPRQRVKTSLLHQEPDRVPVDFLATPEIWQQLAAAINSRSDPTEISPYYDTSWNAVLEFLQVVAACLSFGNRFLNVGLAETALALPWTSCTTCSSV